MAFQQVSVCRFYVNVVEWLNSSGYNTGGYAHRYHTLPVRPEGGSVGQSNVNGDNITFPSATSGFVNVFAGNNGSSNGFYALLGHNIYSNGSNFGINGTDCGIGGGDFEIENIINSDTDYNGFSLAKIDLTNNATINVGYVSDGGYSFEVGSIIFGTYYDLPHSPDLQLTMSREYDGIKTIETKGGASLSNAFYTKPPMWGGIPAWELDNTIGTFHPELAKSGRRTWDLSFSYLDEGDVWGQNQSMRKAEWEHELGETVPEYLLSDYNFYAQVIHKTNGGQLPFIFQPNVDDVSVFAICKFDMKSFKFDQVANGVYNVKLKIREVW